MCWAGCGRERLPSLPRVRVIGEHGSRPGTFVNPRGLAVDGQGRLYVSDRTGRIQLFDPDGRCLRTWWPPGGKEGRPIAIAVDPAGGLWVANTHRSEILHLDRRGKVLHRWGREGTQPGEFIYPVGLALHPRGRLVVSEYGGNDRIQVFDLEGRFIRTWGHYGPALGEFRRPQSVAVAPDGRLFVADAANHRIQIFSLDGRLLGAWGRRGKLPGELFYPYGLTFGGDGTLFVSEFGNHRVQRFTQDGKFLEMLGGYGREAGRLNTPWNVRIAPDGRIIVADTGNHRIEIWPAGSSGAAGAIR